jgi:hypothetical protein
MHRLALALAALLLTTIVAAQPAKNAGSDAMAAFIAEASQVAWLQIAPDAAFDFIEQVEPFVLDVRNPNEYAAGYIETAINIPLTELDARIGELPSNLDAPMLV